MQGVRVVHSKRGECSLKSVLNIVLGSVSHKTPPTSLGRGALGIMPSQHLAYKNGQGSSRHTS